MTIFPLDWYSFHLFIAKIVDVRYVERAGAGAGATAYVSDVIWIL